MTFSRATITFVTAFLMIMSVMLGMSALLGVEVEAARHGNGYGIATQL